MLEEVLDISPSPTTAASGSAEAGSSSLTSSGQGEQGRPNTKSSQTNEHISNRPFNDRQESAPRLTADEQKAAAFSIQSSIPKLDKPSKSSDHSSFFLRSDPSKRPSNSQNQSNQTIQTLKAQTIIPQPKAGPFPPRPSSTIEGNSKMTWNTDPKAETPSPFRHTKPAKNLEILKSGLGNYTFFEDASVRAKLIARPTPLMSHRNEAFAEFEQASEWNGRNRKKLNHLPLVIAIESQRAGGLSSQVGRKINTSKLSVKSTKS